MMNVTRVKANYQQQKLPKYSGNPLVEALPSELTESELIELMRVLKPLPSFFDELSAIDAAECIKDLKLVYIPTVSSYQIYENVFTEIRKSYLNRNPLAADQRRLVNAASERLKARGKFNIEQPAEYVATAPSILVSGKAGIGKTVSIRRVLSTFPQVIEHTEYKSQVFNVKQIVWMSFDMQASRSRKALAHNFFNELVRVLDIEDGPKFKKTFIKEKDSVDQLFHAMQTASLVYNIGLIHIDEAQFVLNPSTNFKDAPTLPEIEALFNKMGVPIVISTTDDALSTFKINESETLTKATKLQTVRRLSSVAHIKVNQWRVDSPHFNELFSAYYQPSLFKGTDVYSDEFKLQLLVLCAGVTDAISALSSAFIRNYHALTKQGVNVNCLKLLKQVYEARMETWHAPLSNLRKGYRVLLSQDKSIKKAGASSTTGVDEFYDEAEAYTRKPQRKRTSAHHLKPASTVERIDEGDEVIDADSIVASYEKRDES
ncbi:ATP-binding protein [Pseudoalteromonas lipolytica]|uniref:ATP-binding protein n=1 Tax=Pseudoalteromonas lipolytica TaxID=570156 RepID=A0AAD0S4C4_9GAMM|nr:ATP-binding protein [Pseudoalteromonas donghaensis]AXV65936.1 ATP-binding protein [Pseudoalteromonas donghaensis]